MEIVEFDFLRELGDSNVRYFLRRIISGFAALIFCGRDLFSEDVFGFQPDVVINCAALSVPRACEVDPEAAMSVNVPTALVKWLSSFRDNSLLIHLSTDQGYNTFSESAI